ncbi:cytochrome c oxidase subunit 5B, mitochondrial-like [Brevipalpus obovatus]|uniref:cytochrome c oxidase subunit 5B, mitochondrial-like n=1 Tax=Brevipalpus obovatus TaxID=246614 RepID=UPI003D9E3DBE
MFRHIGRLNRAFCQVRHKSSVSKGKNPLSVGLMLEPLKSGTNKPVGAPDGMEHSVGYLKAEIMLGEMGILDPFFAQCTHSQDGVGTKENPHLVPILRGDDERFVACLCEPDQTYLCYHPIEADLQIRCECGIWFKGVEVPHPFEWLPKMI